MTVPLISGGHLTEVSLVVSTAFAKIDLSNLSSGVSGTSPTGVSLPTIISPGFTKAPTLIIPSSSKFARSSGATPGTSRVTSSGPYFVSLTSTDISSI